MLRLRAVQVVALLAVFAAPPPAAAQDAEPLTQNGCILAGDMVLTARSLAVEKVDRDHAGRIMAHIYGGLVEKYPEMLPVRDKTLALAYARAEPPRDLARLVATACMRSGGDQGAMFGTRIKWHPQRPGLRL